jgi:hypothetical protein
MTNNTAERALRGVACGRKSWLFAGSDRGTDRAAVMLTLIITARLNDIDPKAWLADILARTADLPATRLQELLPWEWRAHRRPTIRPLGNMLEPAQHHTLALSRARDFNPRPLPDAYETGA